MPDRILYLAPEFDEWAAKELATAKRDRSRDLHPYEQVEQLFRDFVVGSPMAYSVHCRKLQPLNRHTWELKTEDVRVLGWFPRRTIFIAVGGDLKKNLRDWDAYTPHIENVVDFRTNLDLDEPKWITGVTISEVL